jgi:predicted alpha/beta superfamily hydrolase
MIKEIMDALKPIIEILDDDYLIPQLNRRRRISVLLPYDYYQSNKSYPVLFLHDGQNLFDDWAPYGNWGIDKTLTLLAAQGKSDIIVVAIDHGGELRIRELLPYKTTKFKNSEGELYLHFMMDTLRPMINEKYRVLSEREHTGIGGSSLGGLISLYAGLRYPDIFGKLMIFSPSLWITNDIYLQALKFPNHIKTDVYLYAGGLESANHLDTVTKLAEILHGKQLLHNNVELKFITNPTGRHQEVYWGEQFPLAVNFLFFNN